MLNTKSLWLFLRPIPCYCCNWVGAIPLNCLRMKKKKKTKQYQQFKAKPTANSFIIIFRINNINLTLTNYTLRKCITVTLNESAGMCALLLLLSFFVIVVVFVWRPNVVPIQCFPFDSSPPLQILSIDLVFCLSVAIPPGFCLWPNQWENRNQSFNATDACYSLV